jgi:hypothetical protein
MVFRALVRNGVAGKGTESQGMGSTGVRSNSDSDGAQTHRIAVHGSVRPGVEWQGRTWVAQAAQAIEPSMIPVAGGRQGESWQVNARRDRGVFKWKT